MNDALHDMIADIYEAAVISDGWPVALQRLCALAGFWGGATAASHGAAESWTITPNAVELFTEFATGGWIEKNERLVRLVGQGHLSFVGDLDIFTEAEWEKLPIYRDFLVPRGFGYGAGTLITTPGPSHMIISLERRFADGPAPAASLAMLNHLRPHLARALVLSSELQRQRAQDVLMGLSMASIPAALLTQNCKIVAANSQLDALKHQLKFAARDRVLFNDVGTQALLQKALQENDAVRSFVVPSQGEGDAVVVHIIPLEKTARDLSPLARALMLVSSASSAPVGHFPVLKGLYDLTRAEARVASAMLSAASLPQISRELGLGYETVRSLAKSVYAKTGSSGQADLIRRLSALTRFFPEASQPPIG